MKQILAIAKKELKAYFGSPMAAIFIGAFLLSSLFSFFWLETFFARNIADIRPLFSWMPLLMIFLVAALTMRQWSEEQKMGTLEILLTLPVRISHLVFGKFLAVLILVGLSLALTLGLPLTVALMGDIDWGPVFGGYLGALLMASAYIAIGLFVSSRTDNQIVALILTVLLSGIFYLVGSSGITNFMGNTAGEFLRYFGTSSRFLSIERGVIDLRDIAYYASLSGLFLMLNAVCLDRKRWSSGRITAGYRRNITLATLLVTVNILAFNIWLNTTSLRLDLTENREYSISQPTRDLIENLEEPLILVGYFSEKTHPLLAPLVPRIRDLMEEYEIASDGKITVSFIDPKYDEEAEIEANQQYGIKPVPFQVAGRYEAAVVNSYFNILIKYGDQHVTLGYNDLIEIKTRNEGKIEVKLRNLEYDLTKSIKKTVYGFQSLTTVFENINKKLELVAIITPDTLPEQLTEMPNHIKDVAQTLQQESNGKLSFSLINPDDPASNISRKSINDGFGIQPLAASIFSDETFYLHLLLTVGDTTENIYLAADMGPAEIRQEIEATLKRTGSGFMKTIGLWIPEPTPPQVPMMQQMPTQQYQFFQQMLRENYNLKNIDLSSGWVAGDVDVLLIVAPQQMTDIEKLAIDQYLMRGGSVVALVGNYGLDLNPMAQSLNVKRVEGSITDMLAHYGVTVEKSLVMDMQNEPFPIPVSRDLGGIVVQEIQQINYPFFVDVRESGMDRQSSVTANLPAVTMNWVSPLVTDPEKNKGKTVSTMLRSSSQSWLRESTDIQPDFVSYPKYGFPVGEDFASYPLAVSIKGSFDSFYADKEDPRLAEEDKDNLTKEKDIKEEKISSQDKEGKSGKSAPLTPIIKKSPDSSRLVTVGSSEFISDTVISISQSIGQDRFLNSLEFLQNIIDWSVEDEGLLSIRSRGSHARLLHPMSRREQSFWEWLNYSIAIIALILVSFYGARRRRHEKPIELEGIIS